MRLLIVGNPEPHHVGSHLREAARSLDWEVDLVDLRAAKSSNPWANRFFDRCLRRRPAYLNRFGAQVLDRSRSWKPNLVLSTGVAPLSQGIIESIRRLQIRTVNFLTDDPWNHRNGAGFFWDSLQQYSLVANPRLANLKQLKAHGVKRVEYLPFGYNPDLHCIEENPTVEEEDRYVCDVAILGGADADRLPLARALAEAGFKLALYGGYWDSETDLRPYWRGFVHGRDLRLAVRLAGCHVCMGRRANRDGHAMRSLEFPAMGACLVTEDTEEHRSLFGKDGERTLYWKTTDELVKQVKRLVVGEVDGAGLRQRLHQCITEGERHTYKARLEQIVDWLE